MAVTEDTLVSIYIPVPPEKGTGWYEAAMGRLTIKAEDSLTREVAKDSLKGFIEHFWASHHGAEKPLVLDRVVAGAIIRGCGRLYVDGTGEEVNMSSRN
jgi:hypothetical protein